MATSTYGIGGLGESNEIDLIDVLALMLLPIVSSMIFQVWSMQVNVFGGYDFTSAIWTVGGASISAALLLATFSSGWIMGTNLLNKETSHTTAEFAIFATALAAPVAYVFIPAFADLVMWHDLVQVGATLYVAAAAVLISYTG